MSKSFEEWCEENEITLWPWQAQAAEKILAQMKPYRARNAGGGKSFLLKVLTDFINEHGNHFFIGDTETVTVSQPKNRRD